MWQFPLNAIAPCSWTPEESQVESCEHQDNANIHCQPFPESVSEEHEIYTDYDGCHRHHVKHRQLPVCPFQLEFSIWPRTVIPVTLHHDRIGAFNPAVPEGKPSSGSGRRCP